MIVRELIAALEQENQEAHVELEVATEPGFYDVRSKVKRARLSNVQGLRGELKVRLS